MVLYRKVCLRASTDDCYGNVHLFMTQLTTIAFQG